MTNSNENTNKHPYSVSSRIWIKSGNGHFLGAGRVQLLEQIKQKGSITKAAAEMKMSYRQAWQMVQDMNAAAPNLLVEKILGGKGGGGARLTEAGANAINVYHQLEEEYANFNIVMANKLKSLL